jgi:hypothetical protein
LAIKRLESLDPDASLHLHAACVFVVKWQDNNVKLNLLTFVQKMGSWEFPRIEELVDAAR